MISAMIAVLSLGISNIVASLSDEAKIFIHLLGKAWIPGAQAIGPYSGKETIMLLGWGISWLVLYFSIRNKRVNLSVCTIIFMTGVGIATLLVWNPFVELFFK